MGGVLVDLHSHSTASDGTDAPAEVVRRAAVAGVGVLALTDHDTVAGHAEAAAALRPGQVLVPGAELSCGLGGAAGSGVEGESVHLLAYLFDPSEPALAAELERIRTDRERRARGMVDRLVELGVPVTWERVRELAAGAAVGRPHVARAMVEAGVVAEVNSAFTPEWIAPGGRAYVRRYAPDPAEAVALVRAAGGVTVLAHAYASERRGDERVGGVGDRVRERTDELVARLARVGLSGLEVDHPEHDGAARRRLRGLAASHDLVVTGGSDEHGESTGWRVGSAGTAPEQYERLVSRATGASAVVG